VRICITGNAGYIGTFLSNHLNITEGCDIGWFSKGNEIYYQLFNFDEYDIIIHLAGHSSEPMCNSDHEGAWKNNVLGFKNILDNLKHHQTLIYASSASVYATKPLTVTEEDFISSSRPYDCSKIICDSLAQMHINQGKSIVGLRFGTVAGSSPVQRIDTIVNAMTKNSIEQGEIKCIDPNVRRTILFLQDIANAIEKIICSPVAGIYNLGSINTTVGEIGLSISRILNVDISIESKNNNFYDFHLSTKKFERVYGNYHSSTLNSVVLELASKLNFSLQGRRDAIPTDRMLGMFK
jgi:nucleoside-diphosphate-sugar epimerase